MTRRQDNEGLAIPGWWVCGPSSSWVEPAATVAFIQFPSLDQVGEVRNLSPYAVSPVLWAVVVALGVLVALRLAPTRWGWAAAVVLSVGASPRLLAYQLSSLIAALGGPRDEKAHARQDA